MSEFTRGDWGTVASDALIWEMGKVKVKMEKNYFLLFSILPTSSPYQRLEIIDS